MSTCFLSRVFRDTAPAIVRTRYVYTVRQQCVYVVNLYVTGFRLHLSGYVGPPVGV